MTYNTQTLARIGREVIQRHPAIASVIIEQLPRPLRSDIVCIPGYFNRYCEIIGMQPDQLQGAVYKSSIIELKKVFASAMACLYNGNRLFAKTLTETFRHKPFSTSRILNEVLFRYKKDPDFRATVDETLKKILK